MRKLLLSVLALFACISMSATHILGGEIYYDKVPGTNNYVFTLLIYRDVTGVQLGVNQNLSMTGGGITATIPMTLVPGSGAGYTVQVTCNESVEVHEFKSAPYTVTNVPSTGYTFSWSSCCRPGGVDNIPLSSGQGFYLETKMFPNPGTTTGGNGARFLNPISNVGYSGMSQFFNYAAYDPDPNDSVYVTLDYAQESGGSGVGPVDIPFNPGYTPTNPFAAQTATLNNQTGLFNVTGVLAGRYVASFLVESYTNGVLTSSSARDVPFYFGNSAPINANINLYNIKGTAKVTQLGHNYIVEMNEADSIEFGVEGEHVYMVNGVVPNVTVSASGALLTSNGGTTGNCTGPNCAQFTAVGSSFTNQGLSYATFKFKPGTNFLNTKGPHNIISFNAFTADACGVLRGSSIGMQIKVKAVGNMYSASNHTICYGDSVDVNVLGDTAGITWSPTLGVSDPNSANPTLYPPATTTYMVTNAAGDTIYVNVDVHYFGNFVLGNNGQFLTVPLMHVDQTHEWFYNGAKLNVYSDSLEMDQTGYYWAAVSIGNCTIYSDTVKAIVTNKVANTTTGGSAIGTSSGQASMTFSINHYSNTLDGIVFIDPSISFGKTNADPVNVFLKESGSSIVLWSGIAQRQSFHYWSVSGINVALDPTKSYELEVQATNGDFTLFKPDVLPYADSEDVITVSGGEYLEGSNVKTGALPYFNLTFTSAIGLDEETMGELIYPNPVNDVLTIELNGKADFVILDIQGRQVLNTEVVGKQKIDVSELPSGVYTYMVIKDSELNTGKLVVQ